MSIVRTDDENYRAIADAIREKLGVQTTYRPSDMADAVSSISGGGIASGATPPKASQGSDGDCYVQRIPVAGGVAYVDYLQSSGTQYIDTGIPVSADLDMRVDGMSNGVSGWVLGFRTGSIDTSTIALVASFSSASKAYCHKAFGVSHGYYGLDVASGARYRHAVKTVGTVSRAVLQESSSGGSAKGLVSQISTASTPEYPIVLFGVNTNGSITKSSDISICRVTFYDGFEPIADYLPCLDTDGVACMWDNVAGEYVHNDGTGDFAHGDALASPPEELEPVLWRKDGGAWAVVGR